jgi:hypothetical protein
MGIGTFGARIIGEEAFKKEQAIVKAHAHVYGPRVTGFVPEPEKVAEAVLDIPSLSTAKASELLDSNPHLAQRVLEAELARPDGARVTVLRKILATEQASETPSMSLTNSVTAEIAKYEAAQAARE